jgi:hypothetical protein
LDESHKLDQQPLHQDPRPKSGKSRLNLSGTILEEKSIGSDQKEIKLIRRAHDLKNQDAKLRPNSRIQFASNKSKLIHTNLDPETPLK